jgi:catechol 2,3-dioxygenase-like lactoylglutathione lyase family enzyme
LLAGVEKSEDLLLPLPLPVPYYAHNVTDSSVDDEVKPMATPKLEKMCPSFIVSNVDQSIAFYRDKLGFACWYQQPDQQPFFAIVGRDEAMLLMKSGRAAPTPNSKGDPDIKWDSYILTNDPDTLAAEFTDRGAPFKVPLKDTTEGLRGFEIADPDGYVLFFGRPKV